jgi:hypothetical protein
MCGVFGPLMMALRLFVMASRCAAAGMPQRRARCITLERFRGSPSKGLGCPYRLRGNVGMAVTTQQFDLVDNFFSRFAKAGVTLNLVA